MNIEDVRAYCLAKRGATEDTAFGPDMVLFRIGNKIFACIDLTRPNLVIVKMGEAEALNLREHYRGIVGAWHWNKKYWSEVYLDADVDEHLIFSLIDSSYIKVRSHLPQKTLFNFSGFPEGWRHEHYSVIDSAMNVLHEPEMQQDKSPFLLITADYQTAGRGQGTNTWESDDKKNLLFAFRFYPKEIEATEQPCLLQCISVAVAKTIEKFYKQRVAIKWPNDIYCDDKKICGILIEHTLCGKYVSETRCGIGININQAEFKSSAPNPVSLRQLLGKEIDRAAVLRNFLKIFMQTYQLMLSNKGSVGWEYVRRLYRLSGWYPFRDKCGEFEAKLNGLMDDGRLILLDREGCERIYAHKEVEYILTKKEYFPKDEDC